MESETFREYVCWDTNRLSSVINKEAVSVDRATFLATHASLTNLTYVKSPRAVNNTSEGGLLRELEECAKRDHHTFMVVQGVPGTGKSHLIRWLKEVYQVSHEARNDEVLLIERASSSLRGTLEQILQQVLSSGAFDTTALREQLDRVRAATQRLSAAGLADSILNGLQVAVSEVNLREGDQPHPRIAKRAPTFLLDVAIREQLKRTGGPIERLVTFLQTGTGNRVGVEMPRFDSTDFDFLEELMPSLRGQSYPDALHLAEDLVQRPQLRDGLARYLNRLKDFAISTATALSADDLKEMFYKIRRQLRSQNRNLALFIEDITAFTGLDAGLVDVLVTQHTGEHNREFCRLLSVVGITDNYYAESFPDNIQERVTYRLSLNDVWQGHGETQQIAQLASRYLNALRVSDQELQGWAAQGAVEEQLPNACVECAFRSTCHGSFGAVKPGQDVHGDQEIGLYPFNTTALATMYDGLQTQTRTPRGLLNSVIQYVLHNHTAKISDGSFPPPAAKMGSEFRAPNLKHMVQQQTIRHQAEDQWERVESMVLFWGDRTINATMDASGKICVGELSEDVFRAFSLRPIPGILMGTKDQPHQPPKVDGRIQDRGPTAQPNRFEAEITQWQRGGRLNSYEILRRFLGDFLRSAITWDLYDVPPVLMMEKLANARLQIEGQAGRVSGMHVEFGRNDKLAEVLVALANLHESTASLDDSALGTHLATLGSWKRAQERRLADFVEQPQMGRRSDHSLVEVMLRNCLVLECLEDDLRPSADSGRDLLSRLVKASADPAKWDASKARASVAHGPAWIGLMRQLATRVQSMRTQLLQMLNVPQGGASGIKFLDAATALAIIAAFKREDWTLDPMEEITEPALQVWKDAAEVYSRLCNGFQQVLDEERECLRSRLDQLQDYLGDDDLKETLTAYAQILEDLSTSQQPHSLDPLEKKPVNAARELNEAVDSLRKILDAQRREDIVLRLSAMTPQVTVIQEHIDRFEKFCKFADVWQRNLQERITRMVASGGGAQARQQTEQLYVDIEGVIGQAIAALDARAEVAG